MLGMELRNCKTFQLPKELATMEDLQVTRLSLTSSQMDHASLISQKVMKWPQCTLAVDLLITVKNSMKTK